MIVPGRPVSIWRLLALIVLAARSGGASGGKKTASKRRSGTGGARGGGGGGAAKGGARAARGTKGSGAGATTKSGSKRRGDAKKQTVSSSTKSAKASGTGARGRKAAAASASSKKASASGASKAAKTTKTAKPKKPAIAKSTLERLTARLEEERETYVRQAEELAAEAEALMADREPGDTQFDEESGEGDTINVERERDLALSASARQAVEEIDAALARIKRGTYGICERCGNKIPVARLEAVPQAALCIECKSRQERRR